MATSKTESKSDAKTNSAATDSPKPKRKHTGASKRDARARVGAPLSMLPLDAPNAAKSAAAQERNGRNAVAAGRKERVDAETNTLAFKSIKTVAVKYTVQLNERGLPSVGVHGAELVCERLNVIVEVESMSATAAPTIDVLDDAAFLAKRRDAILRVAPGFANTEFRAKFGINEPVQSKNLATLKNAAQKLLAGKKANPKSRAAKLITADDEKRLRAMIKSITAGIESSRTARSDGAARTKERDILNAALELFYDDYAASIGLVLEDDEVARLHALQLVPRRVEHRAEAEAEQGGGEDSAAGGGSAGAAPAGAAAPVNGVSAPV